MKIFAKRKKRSADASAPEERTKNKSDPVVEELLKKKDPSEWNAKERRMVQRYQQRNMQAEESEVSTPSSKKAMELESDNKEATAKSNGTSKAEEPTKENGEVDEHDDDSSSSSSDGSSDSDSDPDDGPKTQVPSTTQPEQSQVDVPAPPDESAIDASVDDNKVDQDHDIWNLLNQLNSKKKRTLSRKLERLGKSALKEVEKEANQLVGGGGGGTGEGEPIEPTESKEKSTSDSILDSTTEQPKTKKRKKEVDWSSLSPEERLRREEQRRLQKEAAERRARGEDNIAAGHRRPLNSARRRSNRRKPKWKKNTSPSKNEHNSSGYMVRKHGGEQQPAEAY